MFFSSQIILWTSSALLAVATVISTASFAANAAWLALSFVGVAGINFVLVQVRAFRPEFSFTSCNQPHDLRGLVLFM
jgi:hypothetical protein